MHILTDKVGFSRFHVSPRVVIAVAGIALGTALLWWRLSDAGAGPGLSQEPRRSSETPAFEAPVVETETLVPRARTQWLEATGVVRPELEAAVAARILSRITAVTAREGDSVRKGQALIRLDARDLDASVARAGADLAAAQAGVRSAQVAAEMEEAMSRARIAEAKAGVARSEAALESAIAQRDLVRAGPRRQERAQAGLAVLQARSQFLLAETELKRMENLAREGVISRQRFDGVRTQYEVAKAQYEAAQQAESLAQEGSRQEEIRAAEEAVGQARAALEQAKAGLQQAEAAALKTRARRQEVVSAGAQAGQSRASLRIARVSREYAVIAAPFNGIVTARLSDPGAMAAPGVPLMRIQGGALRLEAVVPESGLHAAKLGARIPVRLDAVSQRELAGRIAEIAPEGDPASHTFRVKIDLPRDRRVRAGMFGRARFAAGTDRSLTVPDSAVWEKEGLHYLFVVDSARTARLRLVTTGEPEYGRIPILSGVQPGEKVIVRGRESVRDGQKIRER